MSGADQRPAKKRAAKPKKPAWHTLPESVQEELVRFIYETLHPNELSFSKIQVIHEIRIQIEKLVNLASENWPSAAERKEKAKETQKVLISAARAIEQFPDPILICDDEEPSVLVRKLRTAANYCSTLIDVQTNANFDIWKRLSAYAAYELMQKFDRESDNSDYEYGLYCLVAAKLHEALTGTRSGKVKSFRRHCRVVSRFPPPQLYLGPDPSEK